MSARRFAHALVAICALVGSSTSVLAQSGDTSNTSNLGAPATMQPTTTAPMPAAQAGTPTTVAAGPLEAERKLLLSRIELAKKHGIGTSVYLNEFKKVEEEVKSGVPAESIKGRIDSLTRSLAEQLQRGRNLKTQRPIPTAGSQASASAPTGDLNAVTPTPPASSTGGGSLAEKLKSITNELPPGTLEKLMQNDKARNILERLK